MRKIIVATNNEGKIKEIKQILKDYELVTLKEIGLELSVEENGNTFKENALKKAKEVFKITNIPSIADDSGLCIDILNDWPGVKTSRFLGNAASQEDRNDYILEQMKDKDGEKRNAKVICSIAYVDGQNEFVVEGIIKGKISEETRGNNGFGFDCIFELDNGKTLAELTNEEKNKISSRKIALEKLKKSLNSKK